MCQVCMDSIGICSTCKHCNVGTATQSGNCEVVLILCDVTKEECNGEKTECLRYAKAIKEVLPALSEIPDWA